MDSLIIGLGGSASTDGGAGALRALGLQLLDEKEMQVGEGGASLADVASIDSSAVIPAPAGGVMLLTDVTAPLLGIGGAAAIFAPQKGASPSEVKTLDAALTHFSNLLGGNPATPGSGAAGGAAYGFATVWGARIEPGSDYIAGLGGLEAQIKQADILLTGEGRFDQQSLSGKVVGQLLTLARKFGIKTGVIAGQITTDSGAWQIALTDLAGSAAEAITHPEKWLRTAGARAAQELDSIK